MKCSVSGSFIYNPETYNSIKVKILNSNKYSTNEKEVLGKMINYFEEIDYLLYDIEHITMYDFEFGIDEFEKYKSFLIEEVYGELIEQLIKRMSNYDTVRFDRIQLWFKGLTIDIELINKLDRLFKENGIKILYEL